MGISWFGARRAIGFTQTADISGGYVRVGTRSIASVAGPWGPGILV